MANKRRTNKPAPTAPKAARKSRLRGKKLDMSCRVAGCKNKSRGGGRPDRAGARGAVPAGPAPVRLAGHLPGA